jgi:hypothetical protein
LSDSIDEVEANGGGGFDAENIDFDEVFATSFGGVGSGISIGPS